jgi:hypothetical protein
MSSRHGEPSASSGLIVPDINLLVYAHNEAAPAHRAALAWWGELMSGEEPVGLP